MNEINDLSVSLLLPTELSMTTERIVSILKPAFPDEPLIQKLLKLTEQDIQQLEDVLARRRGSTFTEVLLARDTTRDNAFRAFRYFVDGCLLRNNPEIQENAVIIMDIITKNGITLYTLGYTQESAQLAIMFDELDQPENQATLQRLSGEAWYTELKAAQTSFEEAYSEKVTSEFKEDFPQVGNAKTRLNKHLTTLLDNVSILVEEDTEDTYSEIVSQMNTIISGIMATARARKTREQQSDTES